MKKDTTVSDSHRIAKRKLVLRREKIIVLSRDELHLAAGWAAASCEDEGSCSDICSK